ncbi:helix-turn-helix domain-containing protein [candidate division NPL-UPA2 bacterium]|nr:helix-turn-helix domain-containing protein [candidate division NPL-UPA2 bacterium]
MQKVLTAKGVAKYLHVAPITVYHKAQKGEIPAIRVGRNWRFPLTLLEEWARKKAKRDKGSWKYHKTTAYKSLRKAKTKKISTKLFKSYECGGVKGGLSRRELYSER